MSSLNNLVAKVKVIIDAPDDIEYDIVLDTPEPYDEHADPLVKLTVARYMEGQS